MADARGIAALVAKLQAMEAEAVRWAKAGHLGLAKSARHEFGEYCRRNRAIIIESLAYAAERERLLATSDAVIVRTYGEVPEYGSLAEKAAIVAAFARHRARSSSPAQDEGKPTT